MINQAQDAVLNDSRIQARVKENKQVAWFIQNSEQRGIGRIRNISTSGMLLETEQPIDPDDHHFFSFAADLGHDNFVPHRGQLIWSRPKHKNSKRYLCGVQFVEPSDYVMPKLEERIQKRETSEKVLGYANKVCDWALFTAIIGMTAYTIWMSIDVYQHMEKTNARMEVVTTQQAELISAYKGMYTESQAKLEETTAQLATTTQELTTTKSELVSAQAKIAQLELDLEESRRLHTESGRMIASINTDLEATRKALAESELMLKQALASKTELEGLSVEAQKEFEEKRQTLARTVDQLEKENSGLKDLMVKLESQLAYYEGDVKNSEEAERLIQTYKRNMKLVKTKIRQFRRDARRVFKKAQSERDQLQALLGNNGYFVKDGAIVQVDEEKYIAAGNGTYTGEPQQKEETPVVETTKRKVDVNLEFVE